MKIFKIQAGTEGYKIEWPRLVKTVTKKEIIAEQGFSREPGEFWLVNDPIMHANGSTPNLPLTIGTDMVKKGYSTIVTHTKTADGKIKEHTLFVPFSEVECIC